MTNTRTFGALALVAALIAGGCASPSDPKAMMASRVAVENKSQASVAIVVAGGKQTTTMGASQISDADFREALRLSILESGLFLQVVDGKTGKYYLEAFIGDVSQPMFGLSLTVTMEVSYKLIELESKAVLWQKTIATEHTATMSDSITGIRRLRLANEGAARKNIEAAIAEMGHLVTLR